MYFEIKANLTTIMNNGGMKTKIHFFGSRVVGLARKDSDLDIYIEYGKINSDF
jgi:predicted nucleotidyltransferase